MPTQSSALKSSKMACGTLMESVHVTASSHLDRDFCLSPSLGWLSPRISFSKDFTQSSECAAEVIDSCKVKDVVDRDSLSDFEFSMSMLEDDNATSGQMLAADELFFKGKLLPLYIPEYTEGSEQPPAKAGHKEDESKQFAAKESTDQVHLTLANEPPSPIEPGSPTSPKTPRCSAKLTAFLGFQKAKFQGLQERYCKPCTRQKATMQSKPSPASTACKRFFCRSNDGGVLDARNSAEPLLQSVGEARGSSESALLRQQFKQHPPRISVDKNVSLPLLCCSFSAAASSRVLASALSFSHRSDNEEAGSGSHLKVKVKTRERKAKSWRKSDDEGNGAATGRLEVGLKERSRRVSGNMERMTGVASPGRRSGAMSPAGSSGRWSPGRYSGGWSPGRSSACASPSRVSIERSSSSSPRNLHKSYDHVRAVRQSWDGWRGLERSSSYSSVRVTPVLNVHVVGKHSGLMRSGARKGSKTTNNAGFGLAQILGSAKSSKTRRDYTPAAQIKPKPSQRVTSRSSTKSHIIAQSLS